MHSAAAPATRVRRVARRWPSSRSNRRILRAEVRPCLPPELLLGISTGGWVEPRPFQELKSSFRIVSWRRGELQSLFFQIFALAVISFALDNPFKGAR